ncbi:MAG: leucine-rich repeat domain-containing protein, partial [Christensenellales bacterium]
SEGLETIGTGAFIGCYRLSSIELPASLTYIGMTAFKDCSEYMSTNGLTAVTIKSNVLEIEIQAFDGCQKLATVNFISENPQYLWIRAQAFYNCFALTEIVLPENTAYIGQSAFRGTQLANITIASTIPPEIITASPDTFEYLGSFLQNIYVPSASLDAYEEAWALSWVVDRLVAIP